MLKTGIFFILPLLGCCQTVPKVLVMAFDGMRWDYITPESTPFIWSIAQKGIFAPQGISNQIITVTAPNFYSISTGLYEENHGIVGNTFYDPKFNDYYDYWNFTGNSNFVRGSRDGRWYSGEPIWQTNEKAGGGRRSGAMRWPAGDAKINNLTMTYCEPFNGYFPLEIWKQDIDQLVSWFTQPNPINLGLYYNPQPDHIEHGGDIYRQTVRDTIGQLDNLTAYMFDQLKANNLLDNMNIILVADHGHANVDRDYNMLTIDDIIGNIDDVIISQNSLFPRTDKGITTDMIYQRALRYRNQSPKFDVYLKTEIPDDWHYKASDRIGPVILMEKLGYKITSNASLHTYIHRVFGQHGYSKFYPEMRPFFVASGPAFKSGWNISAADGIQNVDLYPLMAYLLNVSAPVVDGRLDKVANILQCQSNCEGPTTQTSSSTASPDSTVSPSSTTSSDSTLSPKLSNTIVAVLLLICFILKKVHF